MRNMTVSPMDKDMEKKHKAMAKRLKSLGSDNTVVAKAIKKNSSKGFDAYEDFEIVHELVSAAMAEYADNGDSLSHCMKELGKAIVQASAKLAKQNGDVDEDDY